MMRGERIGQENLLGQQCEAVNMKVYWKEEGIFSHPRTRGHQVVAVGVRGGGGGGGHSEQLEQRGGRNRAAVAALGNEGGVDLI